MTEENRLRYKNKREEQNYLYDKLEAYCQSDAYPFHMPGHKRNREFIKELTRDPKGMPYRIDITEIDGFDNLHHAEGILLEGQQRAAELYGAEESFYLINGSTCGILASVFACTSRKGKILMARNCHKAVYHAVELRELQTEYLYPQKITTKDTDTAIWQGTAQINGAIDPKDVESALQKEPGIQAVVLTSPTYDGVVSDVKRIADIAHRYGAALIVDEAHGAHFGFHPYFPENSLKQGADLVIHSLHKTLPSMTQTALLHRGKNCRISSDCVKKYLDIFETSSPSYVFMAGMDQCIRMLEERGTELFTAYAKRLQAFRKEIKDLPHVHLLSCEGRNIDPGKLVIAADGLSGQHLADILRTEYHLEMEMAAAGYVIALTSIADTEEGFLRLKNALIHISERISTTYVESSTNLPTESELGRRTKVVMTIAEAAEAKKETTDMNACAGQICGEYIYLYPPGIPLAVPGEQMTLELICYIEEMKKKGLEIQGLRDYTGKKVDVCRKV